MVIRDGHRPADNSDIVEHLGYLYDTAKSYNNVKILELGTRDGNSTKEFIRAASERGGKVTSVDINDCKKVSDSSVWEFIQKDDREFVAPKDYYDIVFIDSSHEQAHTLFELETFSKSLKKRGVILIHDTLSHGVEMAIKGFLSNNKEWEYTNRSFNNGLGTLKRRKA